MTQDRRHKLSTAELYEALRQNPTVPLWPIAGQALGLGRGKSYRAGARGEIPTIEIGKTLRVPSTYLLNEIFCPTRSAK
jgi:hypothetical protein